MMFAKLSYLNNAMYLTLPTLFNAHVDAHADQTKDQLHSIDERGILYFVNYHVPHSD